MERESSAGSVNGGLAGYEDLYAGTLVVGLNGISDDIETTRIA